MTEKKEKLSKEEIEAIKDTIRLDSQIHAGEIAIQVQKETLKKQLLNGLGKEIKEALDNPKKPSFWVGLKYKYARWKTIRDCNKKLKKILKDNKKNGGL